MKISESELIHEQEFMEDAGGVSSFEDFWMFLAFAMVLIVFILMGFVSYLNKLQIDTIKSHERTASEPTGTNAEQIPENIVDIYVRKDGDGVYYTVNRDMETKYRSTDQIAEAVNSRSEKLVSDTVVFNIYAPGDYYYEDVMRAAFTVDSQDVLSGREIEKVLNMVYEEDMEE